MQVEKEAFAYVQEKESAVLEDRWVHPLQRTPVLVVRAQLVVAGGGSDGYYLQAAVVEWVGVAS